MAELPNGFKADRKGLNITVSLTETDQFKEIAKLLAEMISDLREDIPSEPEKIRTPEDKARREEFMEKMRLMLKEI